MRASLADVCIVSQTDIEITREEDFSRLLQMEEEYIKQICDDIIRIKPDLLFTEKGVSGNWRTRTHTHAHKEADL